MPSLNALRAFEAAARHRSITRAADELAVTPGAVSRQVKEVEAILGVTLLDRRTDGLHPTVAGAILAEAMGHGLAAIREGLAAVRTGRRRLSVGAYSAFAHKWLIPRWAGFADAHPDVELALTTTHNAADLRPERFDVTIFVTDKGSWPGHDLHRLLPIETTPVCAPGEVAGWPEARLLHARPRPQDWPRWLADAGIEGVDVQEGPVFESITLAAEAAAKGLGMAMGIRSLLTEELSSGRLVAPFNHVRVSRGGFVLAVPTSRVQEPAIAAFTAWALAEAGMA
ncbi:LysR substrate-binding domain-containing protein [Rhodovarius crocodyli]|nr:LysR substrate-binding domain-containing protein [Rhodovarius crocodyli]